MGARTIRTSSLEIIHSQHKALADMAGQSLRNSMSSSDRSYSRKIRGGSKTVLENSILSEKDAADDTNETPESRIDVMLERNESTHRRYFDRLGAPPLNRLSSLGLDEMSLDALCKHVSELMGGDSLSIASSHLPATLLEEIPEAPSKITSLQSNFDLDQVDIEEQRREFQCIQQHEHASMSSPRPLQRREALTRTSAGDNSLTEIQLPPELASPQQQQQQQTSSSSKALQKIEVGPGEYMPFYGCKETHEALMNGQVTITKCVGCSNELIVTVMADLVICSECWLFSPIAADEEGLQEKPPTSVGMGIKGEEVKRWLEEETSDFEI